MIKVTFKLNVDEDGWPPVSSESIWCEQVGEYYRVKNTPFFVKSIAYNDVIKISFVSDTQVILDSVIEQSGCSTVWLFFQNNDVQNDVLSKLQKIGCGYEGGALDGYFAVNVDKSANMSEFENILHSYVETHEVSVAYPADRHG